MSYSKVRKGQKNVRECISHTPLPSVSEAACPGFEMSPEVQNRGISIPTKRIYVLQIFLKKDNEVSRNWLSIT